MLRPETIKLLEENIGKTLSAINHSRILYDPPPRVMEIKAKINEGNLIKLKSFCTMKESTRKGEKTAFKVGEITANEATDKELISKTCKQLLQLNSRKINDPIENLVRESHWRKWQPTPVFVPGKSHGLFFSHKLRV